MVHLGIETGTKGYRMYDVKGRKLVISRYVTFEESRPWNWWQPQTDSQSTRNRQGEFVIHMHPTHPVPETKPSPHPSSMTETSSQDDSTSSHEGTTIGQDSTQSEPNTPESSIRECGPMLPRLPTDIINLSDPSMAEEDTYDDTPPQGWRNLSDIYNLLLTEGEPTKFKEAAGA